MKKTAIISVILLFVFLSAAIFLYFSPNSTLFRKKPTIKVGVLHSMTGTMAISERSVVDATLLAIEEINKAGGVMGMQVVPIVADGKSDPYTFKKEAERLITEEGVKVIFGCWTSASRKAVKPVVEGYNALLFYPIQYEGLEQSTNIVYLGAAPNQQLIPAVKWACDNLGKKFFLIGSDYVFPKVANEIANIVIGYAGGEVVGEEYVPLGGKGFDEIIGKIKELKPDVILNTINGDSNIAFFESLHDAEIDPRKIAIMSLSVTENEIRTMREYFQKHHPKEAEHFFKEHLRGTYACWNYFESIDSPSNRDFIGKFKKRFGKSYKVTDPMEAAYSGVYLWSDAVNECKDADDTRNIINHLYHISMPSPEGIITISGNNHARKTIRIGRLNDAGDFDIIWTSASSIEPMPYPYFRDKPYWSALLYELYHKWGGHWAYGSKASDSGDGR